MQGKFIVAIVAAFATVFALYVYWHMKYVSLDKEYKEAQEHITVLKIQIGLHADTIQAQNEVIDAMKIDSKAKIDQLNSELVSINSKYSKALSNVKTVEVIKYKTLPQKECIETLEKIDSLLEVYYEPETK